MKNRVLFICHGNICRSPMAEFVLKDMVKKKGVEGDFFIASAATSSEEIGNPVHYGTREKLREYGISTAGKYARKLTSADRDKFDWFLCMDDANVRNTIRILGAKEGVCKLLSFASLTRDIADPWFTGDFDETYDDVVLGCNEFLKYLGY